MKDVYTLDDLASRAALDEGSEHPARLAVLGSPVAHSLSPQLHQAALDELELLSLDHGRMILHRYRV